MFLLAASFLFDPVAHAIHQPIVDTFGLPMIVQGEMALPRYAALMIIRMVLDFLVVMGVYATLGRRLGGFPLVGATPIRFVLIGLATGLVVMTAAIVAIIATKNADAAPSSQSVGSAISHGAGWMMFDFIGATGEELYGRVAVLLVAERFVGWRGAAIISGLVFLIPHLGNPGANWVWLLRLFVQGVLLAIAVYRTESFWWGAGYHTGWNWASAPLFGAAGSGYLDQGHLLDFAPTGPAWITGGTVGPEGSLFAFIAVLCAFGLLLAMVRPRPLPSDSESK
jgi:membrane protease YdiL (CAAX protease family)